MEVPIFALVSIVLFATSAYGWDEIEVEALLRFKEGLTNPTALSNWARENSHQLCSSWEGVTCNKATGHVEELVLEGFQGILSPEISKLSFLTRLELCGVLEGSFKGRLEGAVPSEIGLLTNLKSLNLSWNSFTGRIPQELCQLTKLEILDLSGNRYVVGQIPERLGMMKRLRELHLSETNLNGSIPPSLAHLVNLEILDLSWNSFVGQIPEGLGMMKRLRELHLRLTNLNGSIPPSLAHLVNLEILDLSLNSFVGQIPERLGMMKRLRDLHLSGNNLNGSIPPSLAHHLEFLSLPSSISLTGTDFGNLRNLKLLYLTGEVIPQSIFNCSSLEEFDFQFAGNESRRSSGNFPASVDKLHKLKRLKIWDLYVRIPEEIGNCSKLEEITIWGAIHGSIPRSIFHLPHLSSITLKNLVDSNYWHFPGELLNMTHLEVLVLANASLTGRLPNFLGSNWTALETLDLRDNQLQGEVPPHVWQIPHLDLSYNRFTGRIPTLDLSQTYSLHVSNNQLDGEILIYNSSASLRYLYLSNNNLTGKIPNLSASLGLSELNLSHNNLTGEIPSNIGIWCENLEILFLEGNRLQGNIPRGLENCTQLLDIGLGKNLLGGRLDINFTNLTSLQVFNIPDNSFEGEFPMLGTQDSLIDFIDMRGNRFSGEIPAFVGQLRRLEFLVLRENMFHGNFPAWLSNMSFIQILDLSGNKLFGNLPSDFGQQMNGLNSSPTLIEYFLSTSDLWVKGHYYEYSDLPSIHVTIIDLSSNMLSGEIPWSFGSLKYLEFLNLSHNAFSGSIPESLSNLTWLEQLDLSSNKLTGIIPETFKSLDFLGVLNLSSNALEGRIPFEGHMSTFDINSFNGNPDLCGKPLEKECSGPLNPTVDGHHSRVRNEEFATWWKEAISPFGFALGFTIGLVLTSWLVATKM